MTDNTPDFLKRIIARKTEEVAERRTRVSTKELSARVSGLESPRDFLGALENKIAERQTAVIAEIKRASPSRGVIRADFDAAQIAASYERAGAACLSVLTDMNFFQGADAHLRQARAACRLPILRKDFVVDTYQIHEARALGADCILLIVAALSDIALKESAELAWGLGMEVLIEVHDCDEIDRALALNPKLIGINNRCLRTFAVRLETTVELLPKLTAKCLVVVESGIYTHEDVAHMRSVGANAFLVGEALMRAPDPGAALSNLFGIEPRFRVPTCGENARS